MQEIKDYILKSDIEGLSLCLEGKDSNMVLYNTLYRMNVFNTEHFDPSYDMLNYIIQMSTLSGSVLII